MPDVLVYVLQNCQRTGRHTEVGGGNMHQLLSSCLPPNRPLTIDHTKINIVSQGAVRRIVAVANTAIQSVANPVREPTVRESRIRASRVLYTRVSNLRAERAEV